MKRITFDLDGTLCHSSHGNYLLARPIPERIKRVQREFANGAYIIIDTSRGTMTGVDWMEATALQLEAWGVPYHELRTGLKPFCNVYVGDEVVHADDFFSTESGHPERWPDEYFAQRIGNDPKRLASFRAERDFLREHVDPDLHTLRVCDVGCSTGEFLWESGWAPETQGTARVRCYGMEISDHARAIAETKNHIHFDRDIFTESEFFDVVIFRGTIQHLPHPFRYIERAFRALKHGGHIAFLATPNTGSLVYRLFQELPVSDDPRNYWMPSAKTLSNALQNFGFEIVAVEYPYLKGGYARPWRDGLAFARRLLIGGKTNFPFPGNMMNLIALKP